MLTNACRYGDRHVDDLCDGCKADVAKLREGLILEARHKPVGRGELLRLADETAEVLGARPVARDPGDQPTVDLATALLDVHDSTGRIPTPEGIGRMTPADAWNLGVGAAQLVVRGRLYRAAREAKARKLGLDPGDVHADACPSSRGLPSCVCGARKS